MNRVRGGITLRHGSRMCGASLPSHTATLGNSRGVRASSWHTRRLAARPRVASTWQLRRNVVVLRAPSPRARAQPRTAAHPLVSSQALILALAAPAAGFSFGNTKTSAQTYVSPFKDMPGAYGWAAEKGLAYSFGKPFSQQKFPDLVNWVQEAEIKHARVAMLAALGYPVAEVFHPLWGGSINEPSLIAFQATPLQTFWPIVVGAIGLIESAS